MEVGMHEKVSSIPRSGCLRMCELTAVSDVFLMYLYTIDELWHTTYDDLTTLRDIGMQQRI